MIELLEIIGPVFSIMALGYITLYSGYLSESANIVLPKYATAIAVPCLLFRSISQLDFSQAFDLRLLISYYMVGLFCFLLTMKIVRQYFSRGPGGSVAVGFSVLFGNSVFMGLPIAERAYGAMGEEIAYGIVSVHAVVMYLIGSVTMESVSSEGHGVVFALRQPLRALMRNPLVIGIFAGFSANIVSLELPVVLANSMDLLAQTALPVGVFSIGAALTQYKFKEQLAESLVCTSIKLLVFPLLVLLITYIMGVLFQLPFEMARVAVILAALPSGINVYLFAAFYHRAEALAASVLLISTMISIVTISIWLVILDQLRIFWP